MSSLLPYLAHVLWPGNGTGNPHSSSIPLSQSHSSRKVIRIHTFPNPDFYLKNQAISAPKMPIFAQKSTFKGGPLTKHVIFTQKSSITRFGAQISLIDDFCPKSTCFQRVPPLKVDFCPKMGIFEAEIPWFFRQKSCFTLFLISIHRPASNPLRLWKWPFLPKNEHFCKGTPFKKWFLPKNRHFRSRNRLDFRSKIVFHKSVNLDFVQKTNPLSSQKWSFLTKIDIFGVSLWKCSADNPVLLFRNVVKTPLKLNGVFRWKSLFKGTPL